MPGVININMVHHQELRHREPMYGDDALPQQSQAAT